MLKTLGLAAGIGPNHTRCARQPVLAAIACFRLRDGLGRADMHPQAFQPQAVQASGFDGAGEQLGQRERALRRAGKQPRRQDGGAGIDEGRDLALGARAQAAVRRP